MPFATETHDRPVQDLQSFLYMFLYTRSYMFLYMPFATETHGRPVQDFQSFLYMFLYTRSCICWVSNCSNKALYLEVDVMCFADKHNININNVM